MAIPNLSEVTRERAYFEEAGPMSTFAPVFTPSRTGFSTNANSNDFDNDFVKEFFVEAYGEQFGLTTANIDPDDFGKFIVRAVNSSDRPAMASAVIQNAGSAPTGTHYVDHDDPDTYDYLWADGAILFTETITNDDGDEHTYTYWGLVYFHYYNYGSMSSMAVIIYDPVDSSNGPFANLGERRRQQPQIYGGSFFADDVANQMLAPGGSLIVETPVELKGNLDVEGKTTFNGEVCYPAALPSGVTDNRALGLTPQGVVYSYPQLESVELIVGEFERDASDDVIVNSGGQIIGNLQTGERIRFNEDNFLVTTAGSALEDGTLLVDFNADSLSLNVAIDGGPQPTINNILRFDPNGFAFDTLGSGEFQITALSGVSTTWIDGDTTYSVSAPDEVVFDEGVSIEADSTNLGDFSSIDPTSVRLTYYDPNHDYTPETALQHDGVQVRFTDNDLTFPPGGYKIGDFLVVNGLTTENDTYGIGALMQAYSDANGGFVLRRDETSFNGFFITFQSPTPLNAPANSFATADVVTGTFSVERRRILASWDGATVDGNTGVKTINFGSSATVTPQTDTSIIDVAITAGITVEGRHEDTDVDPTTLAGVTTIDFAPNQFVVKPFQSGTKASVKINPDLLEDFITGITVEGFNSAIDQENTGITDLDFDNNHFRVAPGASGSVDITSNFTVRGENNGTSINAGGTYDLTFNVDNFNVSGSDGVIAVAWAGMDVEGNEQTGTIDTNTSGITKLDFDNDYFYVNPSGTTAAIRSRFVVQGYRESNTTIDQAVVDVNKIDFKDEDFIVEPGVAGEAIVSVRPGAAGVAQYIHTANQSLAATTWTVDHNLGTLYPIVQVYEAGASSTYQVIPDEIISTTINRTIIQFQTNVTGTAVLIGAPN